MLDKDNETKFSTRIIRLNITKVLCFKLKRHSNTNMHSHNLSAHLWYKSEQLKGKIFVQIPQKILNISSSIIY